MLNGIQAGTVAAHSRPQHFTLTDKINQGHLTELTHQVRTPFTCTLLLQITITAQAGFNRIE